MFMHFLFNEIANSAKNYLPEVCINNICRTAITLAVTKMLNRLHYLTSSSISHTHPESHLGSFALQAMIFCSTYCALGYTAESVARNQQHRIA